MVDSAKFRRRSSSSMIWRRWVTESSSSATQTSSDHLDRRLRNTRMRPPQSGLVQVGLSNVISGLLLDHGQTRNSTGLDAFAGSFAIHIAIHNNFVYYFLPM